MFIGDLTMALFTLGLLSGLAFLGANRLRSNCSVLFVTVCFLATISIFLQGRLGWAKVLPLSSAILLANPLPILLALLAAIASKTSEIRPRVRPIATAALLILAALSLVSPLTRSTFAAPALAQHDNRQEGFLVLQSHDATCAPASAASLLRIHGIDANEADMARRCLTSEFGTEALGLYRGLSLGCKDTDFSAQIASGDPEQWPLKGQLPNVALVKLYATEYAEGIDLQTLCRNSSEPHWYAGGNDEDCGHAVVVLGFENGKWRIADPAVGVVFWSDEELRRRFNGDAICLSRE